MVLFGQKWLCSGKVVDYLARIVVFGQSGFIQAKVVVFGQSGLFGQGCCVLAM